MTTEKTTDDLPISEHPDIVAMRQRYEQAFETPQAWVSEGLLLMPATYAASNLHLHGLTWVAPLLGIWLIITPWVVRGTDRTAGLLVSNVVVGACIVLIGAAMTGVSMRRPRH